MNPLAIFWVLLSIFPGGAAMSAALSLYKVIGTRGSLYPFLSRLSTGIYGIIFSVLLLIGSATEEQAVRNTMMIIWIIIYIFQQVFDTALSLFLSGLIRDPRKLEESTEIKN